MINSPSDGLEALDDADDIVFVASSTTAASSSEDGFEHINENTDRGGKATNLVYGIDFEGNFGNGNLVRLLREKTLKGKLRRSKFRGLLWSYFLGLIREEKEGWPLSFGERRRKYESLKTKYCCRIDFEESPKNLQVDNPLSQDSNSAWNRYFKDTNIKKEIHKDVVRTYPGNDFFRDKTIQNLMTTILFIYAKEHTEILYKQGMHELLAAVLLVLKGDIDSCLKSYQEEWAMPSCDSFESHNKIEEGTTSSTEKLLRLIYDEKYLEHDSYFLFEKIMEKMWDWYHVSPNKQQGNKSATPPPPNRGAIIKHDPQKLFDKKLEVDQQDDNDTCKAAERLQRMWHFTLRLNDQELYEHLEALEVIPTTFGINWMKLLFSRQFSKDFEFLYIWDVIFANETALTDYVFVAMIIAVRPLLINGDSNVCNSILVSSYPKEVDYRFVIDLSLNLQDGIRYPRPSINPLKRYLIGGSDRTKMINQNVFEMEEKQKRKRSGKANKFGVGGLLVKRPEKKAVELSDYLIVDDDNEEAESITLKNLDRLKEGVASWHDQLDFNIEFLIDCFRDQDIQHSEKFDKILQNLKQITEEMRKMLIDTSKSDPRNFVRRETSVALDALELLSPPTVLDNGNKFRLKI